LGHEMTETDLQKYAHFDKVCSLSVLLHISCSFFDPENGGSVFLQNTGEFLQDMTQNSSPLLICL
jgi:hypothetical protein